MWMFSCVTPTPLTPAPSSFIMTLPGLHCACPPKGGGGGHTGHVLAQIHDPPPNFHPHPTPTSTPNLSIIEFCGFRVDLHVRRSVSTEPIFPSLSSLTGVGQSQPSVGGKGTNRVCWPVSTRICPLSDLFLPRSILCQAPIWHRPSGVESQGGPRGSTTHGPPYRPTPPPAHEKLLNQRAPGGLGPP